jgi:hypothetical protein
MWILDLEVAGILTVYFRCPLFNERHQGLSKEGGKLKEHKLIISGKRCSNIARPETFFYL